MSEIKQLGRILWSPTGKPVVQLNYPSSPSASNFVKTSDDDVVIRLSFRLRCSYGVTSRGDITP
jgi:hypothetical protein